MCACVLRHGRSTFHRGERGPQVVEVMEEDLVSGGADGGGHALGVPVRAAPHALGGVGLLKQLGNRRETLTYVVGVKKPSDRVQKIHRRRFNRVSQLTPPVPETTAAQIGARRVVTVLSAREYR